MIFYRKFMVLELHGNEGAWYNECKRVNMLA